MYVREEKFYGDTCSILNLVPRRESSTAASTIRDMLLLA